MLYDVVDAVPLLLAAAGLVFAYTTRPGSSPSARLDVVVVAWCAVSLLVKQIHFMTAAGLDWSASAGWGVACVPLLAAAALLVIPDRRWRIGCAWLLVCGVTLLLTIDRLYFAWFEDMFPTVGWLAIGNAAELSGGVRALATRGDAWPFLDVIVAFPMFLLGLRLPKERHWRAPLGFAGGVALLPAMLAGWQASAPIRADHTIVSQRFSNISLVERIGPLPFHIMDGWLVGRRALRHEFVSDDTFEQLFQWMKERSPLRAGAPPWFGAARGRNLIVIQVESLQEPMVDLRIDGHEVMPTLHKLASEHMYFPQVIDQTDEGRTSDAEWMMLTSQLPEPQGAAAFADAGNHVVGLPSVLAEHGYQSMSAVAFAPGFWNRRVIHPNYGFFRSYFAPDFTPGARVGWGLNDRDFLMQMVPRLESTHQPFMAWMVTLSLHYPFEDFPENLKAFSLGAREHTPFGNYVHGLNYFDRALNEFVEALRRDGMLDNSLLVVVGDHSAGLRWVPDVAHALGFSNDIAHWTLAERVPMMVRFPGDHPERIERAIGQVSFAPTVLNLLGIDASTLPYVGRNALGDTRDEPVIRRKGGWVTEKHLFLLRGAGHGTHCYDRGTGKDVDLSECDYGTPAALRKALLPRRINEFDLQQRLRARLVADASAR